MSNLIEEFQRRRQLLSPLNYNEAKTRLSGFLVWMESNIEIKNILDQIRNSVDLNIILNGCDYYNPPKASTLEEIAGVGIYLMEKCRDGEDLFQLAYTLGIIPPFSSSKFQDLTDEATERFIKPTINIIEDRLQTISDLNTIDTIIEKKISSYLSSTFKDEYPFTIDRLQKIAEEFARPEQDNAWFNVGNSCREVLKTFSAEIRKNTGIDIPEEIKTSDVKNILKHILKDLNQKKRFQETLIKLITSVWDHIQSIIHRNSTSKDDAIRVFIWTSLSIFEIIQILKDGAKDKSSDQDIGIY